MTTYDANGVARYQENDLVGPVSDLLNVGMQSVSQAIDLLRNEVTSAPGAIAVVPNSPWVTSTSYPIPTLVEINGICMLTAGMIIRSTPLSVPAGGLHGVASTDTGGLPHELLPPQETYGTGVVFAGGTVPVPVYVHISPVGQINFQPPQAVNFGAGGPTNSIRIPTIAWAKP